MTEARYAPGTMRAIVTDAGAALIAADLSSATLARIWQRMRDGRGFPAVLEALTGAFGTSLTAIPSFAVVLFEAGAVRIAVRGDLAVEAGGEAGAELITGAGVTTWTERVVDGAENIVLRGRAVIAAELPVHDGVVFADTVELAVGTLPTAATPATGIPVAVPAAPEEPAASEDDEPAVPEPEEPEPAAPAPVVAPAASFVDVATTLVPADSTVSPAAEPTEPIAAVPLTTPADDSSEYDHLWGATVIRSVEDAAVRADDEEPDEGASAASDAPDDEEGDHDGHTVSAEQARALRQVADVPAVDSVPPLAAPRAAAPGRIRLASGQVVLLDRTVVVGRRPRSTRVVGTDLPHLIAVDSPQQDISRSHVELRVEGDAIVATDLHTTNGTMLVRPGADPVRLHPGEPTVVVPGDALDLGDGQTLQVEGLG